MAVVKNLMVRCGADFSGLITASNKAASSVSGVQAAASKTQGAFLNMQKSAVAARTGMGGLEKASGKLSSALSKVTKIAAAAFSVKALVDFGKSAIEIGSNVAEVQNVVDTAFGNMSHKIENFAATSIEQFGMSKLSAKKTASTYMAMAKGMGIADESASDMAISLTGLSGDVASFYNISQELADTKLKSVFTGETETLKDLGVVMTQANLDAFAMANGYGKTTSAMTQAEKVQLRYAFVTQQLSLAQGDFAKTSHSWANQTRILSERWKEFMSICGQILIKVLTPLLEVINQITQSLISMANSVAAMLGVDLDSVAGSGAAMASSVEYASDAFEDATESAKELKKVTAGFDEMTILSSSGQAISSGGGAASGGLNLPVATVGNFGEPDTSGVSRATEKVKGLFDRLKNYLTTNFSPAISDWGSAFSGLKEPVFESLSSIGFSFSTLWNDTFLPFGSYIATDFVPTIANSFSETFAPIFGQSMPVLLTEFANDFSFACQEISRYTNDILSPAFEHAKTVAADVFDGIKKSWDEHGGGILDGFQKFKESLRKIWDTVYTNVIKPVFDRISGIVTWLWDRHLKPLWDNLTDFFGSLSEFCLALWNNAISPLFNYIVEKVGPTIQWVVGTIGDVVGTVIGTISDIIGGLIKTISGVLDFLTGVFTGNWNKAWKGIQKTFQGIWDAMEGTAKGVINIVIDGINMLWGGIYNVVKGIVDGIGGIAGALGDIFGQDWHFKMPDKPPLIPKLATGGIVDKATTAVIGEAGREAVLPLENNTGWMDTLANKIAAIVTGNQPEKLVLMVGDTVFGEVSLNSLNALARQRGRLDLAMGAI